MKTSQISIHDLSINTIRFLAADAVEKAKSGHPGTPMGLAPLAYVLWKRFLKHNPKNPKWADRDRFILSAGHASMLVYGLLYLTGYDMTLEDIKQFRQWGSRTPGHPEYGHTPGIETTTGPLGQGFANGVGMAMAERHLASYFNREDCQIVGHYTYCIVSDGDLMEGIASEAASLAGNLALGKLIYFYDNNHITIEGGTDLAFSGENVRKRFEAYGWQVLVEDDGNDIESMENLISQAQAETGKPSLIIVRTHIGYGSPKQDTSAAHGEPLGEEALKAAKQNLDWPQEPSFYVPAEVLSHFREAIEEGESEETEWNMRFEEYTKAYPGLAEEWRQFMDGRLPEGWDNELPAFEGKDGGMATRAASGKVLNAIAPKVPNLFGGSADLAPSTDTYLKGMGDFIAGHPNARNLHFGVREHAMGAILNGMVLHGGLIPFGATFFIFSDYMRPPIRLAALMNIPTIFVFTHDSIGLGEDGPTHEPVEQLIGLRAIPNITVIRPADANETREAWKYALRNRKGPVILVLTRQKLPVLDQPVKDLNKGAYILSGSKTPPQLILIATGSEVSLALGAQKKLSEQNIASTVVSMPSCELFNAQTQEYKDTVLPPAIKARLAIEAASPKGWRDYVGLEGDIIGVNRFGASAPGSVVMEKFGFTVENVVDHALALLGRKDRPMKKNPLLELENYGQGIWMDYLRRDLFSSGELKRYIEQDGLAGMTSNPTIFEKAISGSTEYDAQLRGLLGPNPNTPADVLYEKIAIQDIQTAADLFMPVYKRKDKADGYISLEVSPDLAHDTQGSIEQARRFWVTVARPNVMIKIPATREGIPAIETLISEGINVNITLMFSMAHYEAVAQAYIRGVERCRKPEGVASVASFFVSRVDTLVDKDLEAIGTKEALELRGQVGIANSRMVYRRFREIFEGPAFAALRKKGARIQRPLWASTGTKNPKYSDVLYVEELAGPDTVNTMPPETLKAFRDHGAAAKDALQRGQPQEVLARLAKLGIDLNAVGEKLQQDGVDSFAASFKKLLSALEEKRKTILSS
jgi:transketolase/transaldolase